MMYSWLCMSLRFTSDTKMFVLLTVSVAMPPRPSSAPGSHHEYSTPSPDIAASEIRRYISVPICSRCHRYAVLRLSASTPAEISSAVLLSDM